MKFETSTIIMIIVVIILFFGNIGGHKKSWYDYGNGCVNLSNTNIIRSEMNFSVILLEKNEYGLDIEKEIIKGPITRENVDKFKKNMNKYKGKWESVRYSAFIYFDSFSLRLYNFDSIGLSCTHEDSKKLVEIWLSEYQKLINYLSPYKS